MNFPTVPSISISELPSPLKVSSSEFNSLNLTFDLSFNAIERSFIWHGNSKLKLAPSDKLYDLHSSLISDLTITLEFSFIVMFPISFLRVIYKSKG